VRLRLGLWLWLERDDRLRLGLGLWLERDDRLVRK
jgi:hypothetical protein